MHHQHHPEPQDNPQNPHTRGDDHPEVSIPLSRPAPDNDIDNVPITKQDRPDWRYHQTRPRGSDRRWTGHVHHVHGAEAQRLRGELTDAIADLLHWARSQQQREARDANDDPEQGRAT